MIDIVLKKNNEIFLWFKKKVFNKQISIILLLCQNDKKYTCFQHNEDLISILIIFVNIILIKKPTK